MNVYLYLDRDTGIHRLDPRTKMFMLLGWFVLAFLFVTPIPNIAILAIELIYVSVAAAWSNILRFKYLLITILVVTVIMFGLIEPGSTPLFWFITVEATLQGVTVAFRVVALIVAGLVFLSTTTNEELLIGLVKLKIPYRFAFALSTALRLVPTVLGAAQTIIQAQRTRGLDVETGNVFRRLRNASGVIIPVFVSTIRSTGVFAMALDSKGFGAYRERTFVLEPKLSWNDLLFVLAMVAGLVASIILRTNF